MTAPQPSRKARVITLRLVPGGPDPMTKGLGSFRPSTVVASVGMVKKEGAGGARCPQRAAWVKKMRAPKGRSETLRQISRACPARGSVRARGGEAFRRLAPLYFRKLTQGPADA